MVCGGWCEKAAAADGSMTSLVDHFDRNSFGETRDARPSLAQREATRQNAQFCCCCFPTCNMVRVWYEPPPGGPRTHLNRGAYYPESSMEPLFMKKLTRMRPVTVIVPAVAFAACLAYLPLSKYLLYGTSTRRESHLHGSASFLSFVSNTPLSFLLRSSLSFS